MYAAKTAHAFSICYAAIHRERRYLTEPSTATSAMPSLVHPTTPKRLIPAWDPSSKSWSALTLELLHCLKISRITLKAFLRVRTDPTLRKSRSFLCKCDALLSRDLGTNSTTEQRTVAMATKSQNTPRLLTTIKRSSCVLSVDCQAATNARCLSVIFVTRIGTWTAVIHRLRIPHTSVLTHLSAMPGNAQGILIMIFAVACWCRTI